jgi:hypothetical protein
MPRLSRASAAQVRPKRSSGEVTLISPPFRSPYLGWVLCDLESDEHDDVSVVEYEELKSIQIVVRKLSGVRLYALVSWKSTQATADCVELSTYDGG